jgi:hypothetical protein
MKKSLYLRIAALAIALLGGCASGARIENMEAVGQPAQRIAPTPLRQQLAVREVGGGSETRPLWKSNVGNPEFESALRNSLRATGLLAEGQAARYTLSAQLDDLDQPAFGLNLTVTAKVSDTVAEKASGKIIWQQTLTTPYTAAFADSLVAIERLRLANEGAVRANLSPLIDALFRLDISPLAVR